jgi:hypothetical protein
MEQRLDVCTAYIGVTLWSWTLFFVYGGVSMFSFDKKNQSKQKDQINGT